MERLEGKEQDSRVLMLGRDGNEQVTVDRDRGECADIGARTGTTLNLQETCLLSL